MIAVGDVLVVFTSHTRPPKNKFHVCVAVSEGMFFRINSKAHFRCSLALSKNGNDFLDHDSYIECGALVELADFSIEEAIVDGPGIIGRLSKESLTDLLKYCSDIPTLVEADRTLILSEITAVIAAY